MNKVQNTSESQTIICKIEYHLLTKCMTTTIVQWNIFSLVLQQKILVHIQNN